MAGSYCPYCGQMIPDGASVCPACGKDLNQVPQDGFSGYQATQPTYQPYGAPHYPTYQAPPYYEVDTTPLSIKNYLFMFFIGCIPLVGFIMLLVWAFGNYSINKKNFARAQLIFMLILIGVFIVISIISAIAAIGLGTYSYYSYYNYY